MKFWQVINNRFMDFRIAMKYSWSLGQTLSYWSLLQKQSSRGFCKKGVLEILWFSEVFRDYRKWLATLLKKRLWHRCFPVNFAKFSRRPFFTEQLRWLLFLNDYDILRYLSGVTAFESVF